MQLTCIKVVQDASNRVSSKLRVTSVYSLVTWLHSARTNQHRKPRNATSVVGGDTQQTDAQSPLAKLQPVGKSLSPWESVVQSWTGFWTQDAAIT